MLALGWRETGLSTSTQMRPMRRLPISTKAHRGVGHRELGVFLVLGSTGNVQQASAPGDQSRLLARGGTGPTRALRFATVGQRVPRRVVPHLLVFPDHRDRWQAYEGTYDVIEGKITVR